MTGEIHSFKNFSNTQTGNSLSVTNANTSLVSLNQNVSIGVTVTTSSSARTVAGSVVPNLITSGKSVTTLEVPKNPVVKPIAKPEQNIETVKQLAVTSEKSKLENGSSEKNLDTKKELTVYNPDFANVQKGDYLNTVRIVNKDGSSNIPKGQGIFKVDNRPYLSGSRPSFRKDFE